MWVYVSQSTTFHESRSMPNNSTETGGQEFLRGEPHGVTTLAFGKHDHLSVAQQLNKCHRRSPDCVSSMLARERQLDEAKLIRLLAYGNLI